ncbi:BT_2262 family domain-containing protein [Pseudotamlana carrageenivorans]|uniref:Pesticidal crystal protein Cry22Aa Ig-like domain-containing protein n=1 Tax=Pseudotamlana carrageenivorans TaxID=2069432 RepID=A0A2I7SFH7_9FLAO|nr:BT_2262 family domain-containing protein [Tamlana carrageenivorans]AUS04662.1 hypothetical protein C1A40_03865 [Tamlana carrageenivorans]
MKRIQYLYILMIFISGALASCTTDSTGDISEITTYPIITLTGDPVVLVSQGDTYTDEGAVSMVGSDVIETQTSFSNGTYNGADGVDTNTPDQYLVTYAAENSDGFTGTNSRVVWVANTGDLVNSIEGLYTADVQRAPDFAPTTNDLKYVIISKTGANTYEITHAIGGYYDMGRGYGPGYAARGAIITANDIPSNNFSVSQAVFPIWGNTVDIIDFKVDAAAKVISFQGNGNFGNGTFKVQLKQVQF